MSSPTGPAGVPLTPLQGLGHTALNAMPTMLSKQGTSLLHTSPDYLPGASDEGEDAAVAHSASGASQADAELDSAELIVELVSTRLHMKHVLKSLKESPYSERTLHPDMVGAFGRIWHACEHTQ